LSDCIQIDKGIANVLSSRPFSEVEERLESIVQSRKLTIFAKIDFSGDAEKNGLKMRPTKMLIFGNPKAGTPLMIASPSIAIDLPLKVLIWTDADGKVWLSYNTPAYLKVRHQLRDDLVQSLEVVAALVKQAAG